MTRPERLTLAGPAGELEAMLEGPDTPRAATVVCHPHPLHAGTMLNKVAHTLARATVDAGGVALRFNFRGVGASAGTYGEGAGEIDDALAAAAWLRSRHPDLPLFFAGFSFGARVAMYAAGRIACDGLVTVAPAVRLAFAPAFVQPDVPWLVVQGSADELVDCEDVLAWVNALEPGPELVVMEGVGHFFHGQLTPLRQHVAGFFEAWLDAAQAPDSE